MWKSWKYKNITTLVICLVAAFLLGSFEPFRNFIFKIGYPAALLAGIIFISTFTAPFAAAILLVLAEKFPLLQLWAIASMGAVMSDFLFFKMVKNGLASEIEPIYEEVAGNRFHKVLKTKHFRWMFPVIGTLIILSPLPKEPGIDLLGIHKLTNRQFIALSAIVNVVGVIFVLSLSFFLKPQGNY